MKKNGFTFVELLVVITIIAVLMAAGAVVYSSTTVKSRDAKRRADMEQIRSALEICRSEDGSYPNSIYGGSPAGVRCVSSVSLATTPVDPKTLGNYSYSRPTTTTYTLGCTLEEVGKTCSYSQP